MLPRYSCICDAGVIIKEYSMHLPPRTGDRLTDRSALPDDAIIRDWIGPDGFMQWTALRDWIAASYPGVFTPDWIYGGRKHGWSLRYKKSKAFCTLLPEYRAFSVVIVLGKGEREKVDSGRDRLSPRLMQLYDGAETLHDGKWVKLGVSTAEELRDATQLLALKRPRRAGV